MRHYVKFNDGISRWIKSKDLKRYPSDSYVIVGYNREQKPKLKIYVDAIIGGRWQGKPSGPSRMKVMQFTAVRRAIPT